MIINIPGIWRDQRPIVLIHFPTFVDGGRLSVQASGLAHGQIALDWLSEHLGENAISGWGMVDRKLDTTRAYACVAPGLGVFFKDRTYAAMFRLKWA